MLVVVMLVCSAELSPMECQRETALEVIVGPQVSTIGECALVGQATFASTSLARLASGEFLKIRCEPIRAIARSE
jgi:hypothetical protein